MEHPWIVSGGPAHSDPLLAALDSLKQFHTMNKLKRKALLVPLLLVPHTRTHTNTGSLLGCLWLDTHLIVSLRMLRCTSVGCGACG